MSKYLYNQKYGHYKSIPQSYNTPNSNQTYTSETTTKQDDVTISPMLNKPDFTAKELVGLPYKSIYNSEIDNNKRYLAAVRMTEKK